MVSTYFPGLDLGLCGFGFEAEADNSGQNGKKSSVVGDIIKLIYSACQLHFSQSRSTVEHSMYRQM